MSEIHTQDWVQNTIAGESWKRKPDGWEKLAPRPESTNGHLWKYWSGEWEDTIRVCTQCGKKMFFFRCWSNWEWCDSPYHILPNYMDLAKKQLPQFFQKECPNPIPSVDTGMCNNETSGGDTNARASTTQN